MSTTPIHGSRWTYWHHKCRCFECVTATNDYMREWRHANQQRNTTGHPEGKPYSVSTYKNHGCRCTGPGSCTEANRVHQRAYLDRKAAQ